MGTITDAQSAKMRQFLHQGHFDLMEGELPPLTKVDYKAVYQAVETFWENNRLVLKAAMDTAAGQTISNELAKKIGKYWMQKKWRDE
jgi:hypothetical protein